MGGRTGQIPFSRSNQHTFQRRPSRQPHLNGITLSVDESIGLVSRQPSAALFQGEEPVPGRTRSRAYTTTLTGRNDDGLGTRRDCVKTNRKIFVSSNLRSRYVC
ncbi:MAG: hypothetical protein AAF492_31950 [Verrucomicrobiota bacterium]